MHYFTVFYIILLIFYQFLARTQLITASFILAEMDILCKYSLNKNKINITIKYAFLNVFLKDIAHYCYYYNYYYYKL